MWSPLTTSDKWHLIVLQSPGLDISSPVDNIHQQSPHDSGNDIHKKKSKVPSTPTTLIRCELKWIPSCVQVNGAAAAAQSQ